MSTDKQQHTHTYTLIAKIQRELDAHAKKIEEMETNHNRRMRIARASLKRLRDLLSIAEGIESEL